MQRPAGEALTEPSGLRDALRLYFNHSERCIAEMPLRDGANVNARLDRVAGTPTHLVEREGGLVEIGCRGGASTNALATRLSGYHCAGPAISESAMGLPRLLAHHASCPAAPRSVWSCRSRTGDDGAGWSDAWC